MYHDQGLIPFKIGAAGAGVNFSAGLPVVRTSPAQGTAFEIAGLGTAKRSSMQSAVRMAAAIVGRRRALRKGGAAR
jgi:4-hydroxythreonine-4-phosphate dehydrogenase